MAITDAVFERAMQRKDARVAELVGRDVPGPASRDTTREALEAHSSAVQRAYAKAEVLVPLERAPRVQELVRTWDNDFRLIIGDYSMPASLLALSLLYHERGPELIAEIARDAPEVAEALLGYLRHP